MKDFDSDCEWKWLIGEESEKLYVKVNEEEHKACKKVDENNRQGMHGEIVLMLKNSPKVL